MLGTEERGQALDWVLGKIAAKKATAKAAPVFKMEPLKPLKPFVSTPAFGTKPPPQKISADRKKKEVELWSTWDSNGRKPKDLAPLLSTFANMVQMRANEFRKAEVPTSAVLHQHKKFLVQAFKTWDPKKGGALNTWVQWNLKHARRYVDSNKNVAYIPENISQHIGSYNALKATLTEQLGHTPDANFIHDHILEEGHPNLGKLSLKDIKRLETEQRRGLIQSGHDVDELGGSPHMSSRAEEVMLLIHHDLTDDERAVHEYSFGLNGKAQLKPGSIAKKLKMDNSKVSKLRTSILNKMKKYVGSEDE
jgi:DNA-directed RNA polymerase specialized sigma subunit